MNHLEELWDRLENKEQYHKWLNRFLSRNEQPFAVLKTSGSIVDMHADSIAKDVATLARFDLYAPIIFGWGKTLNQKLSDAGIENTFHPETNDRITTKEMLPYVIGVAKEYGSKIVEVLSNHKAQNHRRNNFRANL